MDELQEEEEQEEEVVVVREGREAGMGGAITELTLLKLSLEGERPAALGPEPGLGVEPPVGQEEALQRPVGLGLVRQRAEQLERLSGCRLPAGLLPEHMELSLEGGGGGIEVEDMELEADVAPTTTSCYPATAADLQMTAVASSPQGSAPIRTPLSSPHGSTLTRCSSSDSLHSVRGGQPGLVRQRAQEIETRMRLAGLTMPSKLKRSSSLAKMDDLTFSTEDLSMSSTCPSDLADAQRVSAEPPHPSDTPAVPWS